MARHYAPTKKKKLTLKLPEMPSLRISALPKLFSREKRSYAPRRFARSFSMGDMLLLMAATLLFIAALLFSFPALVKGLLFAFRLCWLRLRCFLGSSSGSWQGKCRTKICW